MLTLKKLKKKLLRNYFLPFPFSCRHIEYSVIASADDDIAVNPSPRLFDISLKAIQHAQTIELSEVTKRMGEPPYLLDIWPGEHYRLLAGFIKTIKPKLVIEIGTATGLSTLALLKFLPSNSMLITFDIISWQTIPEAILKEEDFKDGSLEQRIGDLADPNTFSNNKDILEKADLIFCDGPKDCMFEQTFLDNMGKLNFANSPLLILDDIKIWNMLKIWRNIKKPKLDLSSFGHWAGTGLVDLKQMPFTESLKLGN